MRGSERVCWHAPDWHALLESGLRPDMSDFVTTTSVIRPAGRNRRTKGA